MATEARHERESSLPPRERECGNKCVGMGERVEEVGLKFDIYYYKIVTYSHRKPQP